MVTAALAFLAGIACLQFVPSLPHTGWLWVCVAFAFAVRRKLRLVSIFLAGFGIAWLQAADKLAAILPADLEGRDLLAQGTVTGLAEQFNQGWRFRYTIDRYRKNGVWVAADTPVRLNWYRATRTPRPGEQWQLRVRLRQPHGFANPGSFDYEGWLYRHDIYATGYVRKSSDNRLLGIAARYSIDRLRDRLSQLLDSTVANSDNRALFKALVIGQRDEIAPGQWEVMRRTGTGHLMAISGLHIGLIAGLVFMVTKRLWVWLPQQIALRVPAASAAILCAFFAAGLYALIAGLSIPTQRAFIMVGAVCLARLPARRADLPGSLAIAMVAVLVHDPASVLSPGFLLSFAAVALIALGTRGVGLVKSGIVHRLSGLLKVQWRLSLGLLPLTIILFQQAAWLSPIANLFAVPWMSIAVVPLAVAGTVASPISQFLAEAMLALANAGLSVLWWTLEWLAALPGARWLHGPPPVWTWLPAIAGIALLLAPAGIPARWTGLILLLPAISSSPQRPLPGEVWLTLLDVGQGLASVVETTNHVLVFDTGPRWNSGFDTGRAVLVPFLLRRGITTVDQLVISHGDNDHIGGAKSLTERLPVSDILASVPEKIDWRKAEPCHAGQSWQQDGVQFRFLHPEAGATGSENNRSCVLVVETRSGRKLLLTGDIERQAEKRLVESFPETLGASVLIAPHHGSRTSSTPDFLAAVGADLVLIPAGYRNRFGFPHPSVFRRYVNTGARIFDTGRNGAISVRIGPSGTPIQVTTFRTTRRRIWHHEMVPIQDRNPYDRASRS